LCAFGAFMVFVSVYRLITGNAFIWYNFDNYWPGDEL
jgi:hypothetical protein